MSFEDTKHSPFQRQRNILYLISQYLCDFGLKQAKLSLWNEANLSADYKICDNIDLDTIYLDFCSYYHLKFRKLPKILRKIENDLSEPPINQRGKVIKSKSSESTTKAPTTEGCQKKGKKECTELSSNGVGITNADNVHSNGENYGPLDVISKYRKNIDLFEQFVGETRELAYIIERQIVRKNSHIKWDDVQGNEQAKQALIESIILPLKHPHLFNDLIKPWKGVLLHGVSGVGKSLLAKALNSETFDTVTFFNISASTLISKWRGESEKFAKILFTMAKSCAPAIIFIDEFESLASRRDSPHDHEATKRFKNELLIQIDDLDTSTGHVLLLANSNLPWEIDEAFLRRFERKILVELPSDDDREKILNHLLPCTKTWKSNKMKQLIELSDGFTGADLKIACKEASMVQIRNKLHSDCKTMTVAMVTDVAFDDLLISIKQIKPAMLSSAQKHRQWNLKYGNPGNQSSK